MNNCNKPTPENIGLGKKFKNYNFSMEQEYIGVYQKKFTITAKNKAEAILLAVEKFKQETEESNGDIDSWHLAEDSLEPTDRSMELYQNGLLIGTHDSKPEKEKITIEIKAGAITGIKNIPPDIIISVKDYDVQEDTETEDENGMYEENTYETGDEL